MNARFKFLSGARAGAVELFRKAYIGVGRHPLSDVRFDAERDLEVGGRGGADHHLVRQRMLLMLCGYADRPARTADR